jgi:hypothetical protein
MPNDVSPSSFADRLRLILLLDACEAADLCPIPVMRFHALIFMSNVISPIWSLDSYDGKVLKRKGGPFYPELQRELDFLIGLGLVTIHDVGHAQTDGRWRLEGSFGLNFSATRTLLERAANFRAEREVVQFVRRLAFSVARLDLPLEQLVAFDATWSDMRTGVGDVIDFSEWRRANYTAYTVKSVNAVLPNGITGTKGDNLQIYMRYLERRAHAASN